MPHPVAQPLGVYQTEEGACMNLQLQKLKIHVNGCDSIEEAEEVAEAILQAVARKRGLLPRLVGDRTPGELLKRLREPR
jgi:hypothetical protein